MTEEPKTKASFHNSIWMYGIVGFFLVSFVLLLAFCVSPQSPSYSSPWEFSPDGFWTGPELWANRLQDWRVAKGQLECLSSLPMRTVHLTTMRLKESNGFAHPSFLWKTGRAFCRV